jgi:hypothetical protein
MSPKGGLAGSEVDCAIEYYNWYLLIGLYPK